MYGVLVSDLLILFWKWAIRNRNTLAALPLGVEVFCLQADIKNDPELPVLPHGELSEVLVMQIEWHHVGLQWGGGCPSYMHLHIYEGQQQSLPKYPEVCICTFRTWLLDSIRASDPAFWLVCTYECAMRRHKCPLSKRTWAVSNKAMVFSSLCAEGELAAPKPAAPSAAAGTSERHWSYRTFGALPEVAIKVNKRKLLGSTEPSVPVELARFAGVMAGFCPHPHVTDWHHGVPKKNIPVS